jgi:hypothetical protein
MSLRVIQFRAVGSTALAGFVTFTAVRCDKTWLAA